MDTSERRKKLLSFKHNQRSQLDFTTKGLYGPKAELLAKEAVVTPEVEEFDYQEDPSCEHHLKWTGPPEKVLIIKKINDREVSEKFKELVLWVRKCGLKVVVEPAIMSETELTSDPQFRDTLRQLETWDDSTKHACLSVVDFIICIGGDGTILYTSTLFPEKIPPIISFHLGSLGFLAPFNFTNYKSDINRVLKGHMGLTLRHRLECFLKTENTVPANYSPGDECAVDEKPKGLHKFNPKLAFSSKTLPKKKILVMNEVVVDRGPSPYLTNLEIMCNERLMTTVQGDGIIIATPTGSTAYSLAAGASMVHPSVSSMVVTPICPHSLSFRPIVVPAGVEISIRVAAESRNSAWVAFDGRNRQEITQGDSVVVTTCGWPVPSINNTGHVTDWLDSLAVCLNWNVRKPQKQLGI